MHTVGFRAEKRPFYVKKNSKIAYDFFVTKATDLKTLSYLENGIYPACGEIRLSAIFAPKFHRGVS